MSQNSKVYKSVTGERFCECMVPVHNVTSCNRHCGRNTCRFSVNCNDCDRASEEKNAEAVAQGERDYRRAVLGE